MQGNDMWHIQIEKETRFLGANTYCLQCLPWTNPPLFIHSTLCNQKMFMWKCLCKKLLVCLEKKPVKSSSVFEMLIHYSTLIFFPYSKVIIMQQQQINLDIFPYISVKMLIFNVIHICERSSYVLLFR